MPVLAEQIDPTQRLTMGAALPCPRLDRQMPSQLISTLTVLGYGEGRVWKDTSETVEREFRKLADVWYKQKGPSSSVTQKSMLSSYQKIIGLGRQVIPLILRELQHHPDHWFWALEALLAEGEESPVQESDKGNIRKMTDAWLRWGKEKRLIL